MTTVLSGSFVLLGSCAGDAPSLLDSSSDDGGGGWVYPEASVDGVVVDSHLWPDTKVKPDTKKSPDLWPALDASSDTWPWPDSYPGSPFGCSSDSECFGLRCCPTPWGVKLCAQECGSEP